MLKPLYIDVVEEDEILVLDFPNTLPIGIGLLTIAFKGILNNKMKGFYTRYNTQVLLVTTIIQILLHYSFYKLLVCVCVRERELLSLKQKRICYTYYLNI